MALAPWLSLIGIGEDGLDGLSPAARARLEAASLVVGGRRHLDLAGAAIRGTAMVWHSPIEATLPAILERRGTPTCVLATGDPFHYGVGALLARHIPIAEMRAWPQPSAFSLAAARLGWSLEDCCCLSVHGRALGRVIPALRHGERLLVLSWDGTTPIQLAALLTARGFGRSRLWVCEAMGGAAERMRETVAASFELENIQALNAVACTLEADPGAREVPTVAGLPDDWFEHDGQITKRPIRAATLAALAPHPGDLLWDVGAGSGSVSIEWLLSHPRTRAIAIERDPVRAARIADNAAIWGVADRLSIVEGPAPAALVGLPRPHAIFIGGGLTASDLLDRAVEALPVGGRLVANAVTIESQSLLAGCFRQHGGELTSLATARAEPVGGFHGFRPAMAVTQWRWIKQ